jgi:hypothetical protein
MLLNAILLFVITIICFVLYKYLRQTDIDRHILPDCKFTITKPEFEIDDNIRIAKYSIVTRVKNRYFRDFPLGFKFYSKEKFRSKIRISYTSTGDEEVETIYDRIIDFDDNSKEHIYYINDVIIGSIDIEIYTNSFYGKPTIGFEILQSNICHMSQEHKIEIVFPA